MEGEQDGTTQEAEERQGQPEEPQEQEAEQVEPALDYRELLDRQEARIAELEAQVAETAKSKESAEALAAEIERVRAEEKVAYELRLAGARNVVAAKALLGEHGGDVGELKAAEPWLFEGAAPTGGTTGLEPAGAAGGDDAEVKRWRSIAGLEDGN